MYPGFLIVSAQSVQQDHVTVLLSIYFLLEHIPVQS
jgi:hypothetical protein